MSLSKNELYSRINEKILYALENNNVPWHKSWKSGLPVNLISKRPYHGINFIMLAMNNYPTPYYLTYLQLQQLKGIVNKGEHGEMVVFWKIHNHIVEENGQSVDKTFPLLRYSRVFNLSQTSLWELPEYKNLFIYQDNIPIQICENIVAKISPAPIIFDNLVKAFYSPSTDIISIPNINQFSSSEEYYATLFHELIHWTGFQNRLNRFNFYKDNKEQYAFEELVAEIGAAYLCGYAGIETKIIDNSSAYISGWIERIKNNPEVIVKASKLAADAVNFILNDQIEENEEVI